MDGQWHIEPTHQGLWNVSRGRYDRYDEGRKGTMAALTTLHRRLGHPSFKRVVEVAQSGASDTIITTYL